MGKAMLDRLFESRERGVRDAQEVQKLRGRYGSELLPELRARIGDKDLALRDRKHWRRILRKARRIA